MQLNDLSRYYLIDSKTHENTAYFFLEKLLQARIALHMESGLLDSDEEMNMYVAGLPGP